MRVCLFVEDRLVLAKDQGRLPSRSTVEEWLGTPVDGFSVPTAADPVVVASAPAGWSTGERATSVSLRGALTLLDDEEGRLALTAGHLRHWRATSRFCGACGERTEEAEGGRAFRCTACGHLTFPRVSPAVIVQVTHGDRILLGRSRRHPPGFFSVLAGFVEPGESLEETVHREIEEESGVRLENVAYFGSQPWPFPDSLMLGFTAEYAGGELRCEDDEMEEVAWFTADALPPVPPSYSIARSLIDDFARRHGVAPESVATWRRPRD